jgi:hypothetical protein
MPDCSSDSRAVFEIFLSVISLFTEEKSHMKQRALVPIFELSLTTMVSREF